MNVNSKRQPFLGLGILAVILSVLAPGAMPARASAQSTKDGKNESIKVSGCLAKADEVSRIMITALDGKAYLVKSERVTLKDHIGQQVVVTGAVMELGDDEEGNEEYREAGVRLLLVTELKVISSKCH